jgi:hypothetical protein
MNVITGIAHETLGYAAIMGDMHIMCEFDTKLTGMFECGLYATNDSALEPIANTISGT